MSNILICDDERSICEMLDITLRRERKSAGITSVLQGAIGSLLGLKIASVQLGVFLDQLRDQTASRGGTDGVGGLLGIRRRHGGFGGCVGRSGDGFVVRANDGSETIDINCVSHIHINPGA